MKKRPLLILATVVVLGAAAFGSARLVAVSPSSAQAVAVQPCDPSNLVLFGHVKSLVPRGHAFELQFDPAWFTTGLTASRAKLEDTGYGDVPNDNYVIEEGHRLLTYILPTSAHITVLTREGRLDSEGFPSTSVTAMQFRELLAGKDPVELLEGLDTGVWMNSHGDTVCSLRQQYHP